MVIILQDAFRRRDILFLKLRMSTLPRLPMHGNRIQNLGRRVASSLVIVGSYAVLIESVLGENCLMSFLDNVFAICRQKPELNHGVKASLELSVFN